MVVPVSSTNPFPILRRHRYRGTQGDYLEPLETKGKDLSEDFLLTIDTSVEEIIAICLSCCLRSSCIPCILISLNRFHIIVARNGTSLI